MTAPQTHAPLISARGISRSFPAGDQQITVLRDVDIDIWPGEMVAIIGTSGSGKSTLMNILGCLDRPSTGTYHFDGRDVGALDPDELAQLRREHFGFIFQRYQLLPDLDAVGNVETPAIYAGLGASRRYQRASDLLGRLGLENRLDHRPNQLSGGQQQRVSVARALMNGGEVILADEPTGALDTQSGEELMRLLLDLNAQGHTIIMVTHDPGVATHAHRVIEISDGRIIGDSRPGPPPPVARPARPETPKPGLAATLRRLIETLGMALSSMRAHKLRSFLTMLGIIIGIASVVLVVALGSGSQQKVLQDISSLGTNTITVRSGLGFGRPGSSRIRTLVPSDATAISTQPYAQGVSPAVSSTATVVVGSVEASATINGVSDDYFGVHAWNTVAGSVFTARDITELSQVAVIDGPTRDTFFPVEDPVGQVLMLGRVPLRVVGVVEPGGATFGPENLNVFIPYTTSMSRVTGQDYLSSVGVQIADGYDMQQAQAEIDALLLGRHGTRDFFLSNTDTIRETMTSTTRTLTLLVAMIAVISLVVGGIGVMNIMLVSVTERTREIGVRIAVGARRSDIVNQFLIEAVLVCLVGGVLGIATALATGAIVGAVASSVQMSFSTLSIVAAFVSSTLIGITFGFLPARAAARLDPVVALSHE